MSKKSLAGTPTRSQGRSPSVFGEKRDSSPKIDTLVLASPGKSRGRSPFGSKDVSRDGSPQTDARERSGSESSPNWRSKLNNFGRKASRTLTNETDSSTHESGSMMGLRGFVKVRSDENDEDDDDEGYDLKVESISIFAEYIKEGSDLQVNVPNSMVKELALRMKNEDYSRDMFDQAQMEIFNLMERDPFPRYCKGLDPATVASVKENGLEMLLSTETGVQAFIAHCATEYSEENMKYFQAVDVFKARVDKVVVYDLEAEVIEIFEEYIKEGSGLQVNVPNTMVKELAALIKDEQYSRDMFNEAQQEIFNLMERDPFPRYCKSLDPAKVASVKEDGLEVLLSTETGLQAFIAHCESEYSGENMSFFQFINIFKARVDVVIVEEVYDLETEVNIIFNEYIKPGSNMQVNIPNLMVKDLIALIKEGEFSRDMFDPAHLEIFNLLQRDPFPRYCKELDDPAVKKNGLAVLLSTSKGAQSFIDHCATEFSDENMAFIEGINHFKARYDNEQEVVVEVKEPAFRLLVRKHGTAISLLSYIKKLEDANASLILDACELKLKLAQVQMKNNDKHGIKHSSPESTTNESERINLIVESLENRNNSVPANRLNTNAKRWLIYRRGAQSTDSWVEQNLSQDVQYRMDAIYDTRNFTDRGPKLKVDTKEIRKQFNNNNNNSKRKSGNTAEKSPVRDIVEIERRRIVREREVDEYSRNIAGESDNAQPESKPRLFNTRITPDLPTPVKTPLTMAITYAAPPPLVFTDSESVTIRKATNANSANKKGREARKSSTRKSGGPGSNLSVNNIVSRTGSEDVLPKLNANAKPPLAKTPSFKKRSPDSDVNQAALRAIRANIAKHESMMDSRKGRRR